MYKILLVDDESIIADLLVKHILRMDEVEIDVLTAYSAEEAMPLAMNHKIDILVTDIRMKDMDGLELGAKVKEMWQDCRVIFLTGFSQFQYAYGATQVRDSRFILKREGFEKVESAILECVSELDRERNARIHQQKMAKNLSYVWPMMEQSRLAKLLSGETLTVPYDPDYSKIDPAKPVLLAIFSTGYQSYDLIPSLDAAFESAALSVTRFPVAYNHLIVYFIQQSGSKVGLATYIWELMPDIQQNASVRLSQPITVCVAEDEVPLDGLRARFMRMCLCLSEATELPGALIRDRAPVSRPERAKAPISPEELDECLTAGDEAGFFRGIARLRQTAADTALPDPEALSAYFGIISRLLAQIEANELSDMRLRARALCAVPADTDGLIRAIDALDELARALFSRLKAQRADGCDAVIAKIRRYVREHFQEEALSVFSIAERFYFSPAYLSRMYRARTGDTLKKYISKCRMSCAKRMLSEENQKVADVARQSGFGSIKYFSAAFKDETGMTPLEWRAQQARESQKTEPIGK